MTETIGFAILGTGMIAEYHSQAVAANADLGARLVAVAHYDPDRFAKLGARFAVPCVSLEEMLEALDREREDYYREHYVQA